MWISLRGHRVTSGKESVSDISVSPLGAVIDGFQTNKLLFVWSSAHTPYEFRVLPIKARSLLQRPPWIITKNARFNGLCLHDKSTLVQVMAWCHHATSHYLGQCWPSSMSTYGVTRPQWVNGLCSYMFKAFEFWSKFHCKLALMFLLAMLHQWFLWYFGTGHNCDMYMYN